MIKRNLQWNSQSVCLLHSGIDPDIDPAQSTSDDDSDGDWSVLLIIAICAAAVLVLIIAFTVACLALKRNMKYKYQGMRMLIKIFLPGKLKLLLSGTCRTIQRKSALNDI